MKSVQELAWIVLVSIFAAASTGCLGTHESALKRETSHVRLLTNLHALATAHLGHNPRDENEFKQAIAKLAVKPERMKIASIDDLFVSERDGQPLVVVYGTRPGNSDVVVYEQMGLNGRRQIGHRIGMVEEVDEAQYKQLTAATK